MFILANRFQRHCGPCRSGTANAVSLCRPYPAPDCIDECLELCRIVFARGHSAPDRAGPCGVAFPPRDDVDMELRHLVAECRHVELVATGDVLERFRDLT